MSQLAIAAGSLAQRGLRMTDAEFQNDTRLAIFGGHPVREQQIATTVPISERVRSHVDELLTTGYLSNYYNGPWARRFEEMFGRYHGSDSYAVAVSSGTSALHLAVAAAGICPGDEVIVPALCFVAAASAVVQNGAIPIICDAEPGSLTMDVHLARRLIGPRTKAILAVHFWGYPSDPLALRELCREYGLIFIEDCAQALGGSAGGDKVGTFGDYATYAFSVRKHIACGEGGMVMARNETGRDRLRELSNYGKGPGWDDYTSVGYSYRLAEFPSIVAIDGLERLDGEVAARRRAAHHYAALLENSDWKVVPEPDCGESAFFKCPILIPARTAGQRKQIVAAFEAENVSCRIPHRPLYAISWLTEYLEANQSYRGAGDCPVASSAHARLIEIETGPNLPWDEAQRTGAALMKVVGHYR